MNDCCALRADCIIRRVVPEPTEWKNIGNEINAPFIFARADFVNVHEHSSKIDVGSWDGLLVATIADADFQLVARYELELAAAGKRDVAGRKLKRGRAF